MQAGQNGHRQPTYLSDGELDTDSEMIDASGKPKSET